MSAILGIVANAFIGTLIEKFINGFLQYFERAATIRQAKELGASDQRVKDAAVVAEAQGEINAVQNTHQDTAQTKKDLVDGTF